MEAMKNWWSGLSTRERWLVGVAGALAVAVLAWALGRPAVAAFLDLESRHRAAIEPHAPALRAHVDFDAFALHRRHRHIVVRAGQKGHGRAPEQSRLRRIWRAAGCRKPGLTQSLSGAQAMVASSGRGG